MDPMTEIFYEESNGILTELRRRMRSWNEETVYGQDIITEIFRGVHTLKADSSMMLYENMSRLSRQYEGLLYCFRGNDKTVDDVPRFISVLDAYLAFFEQETDKLAQDKKADGDPSALLTQIDKYTGEIKKRMEKEEVALYQSNVSRKTRQVFYIASATEEQAQGDDFQSSPDMTEEFYEVSETTQTKAGVSETEDSANEPEVSSNKEEFVSKNSSNHSEKKHYYITESDKEQIFKSVRVLQRIIGRIEYTQDDYGNGMITREQAKRLEEAYESLCIVKKKLNKTDFVPVAGKLEALVDEMCMTLGKNARILIKGVHTPVDHEMREKISSALTHMVRNSMDHGIESMEERERLGKAPVGLIKVRFSMEDSHLKIVVKDDGRGLNTDKILTKALENKMIDRPVEEYTKEEIDNLIFQSGLSTTDAVNDYSGRGVGMDVVAHNITELGGKIKIRSVEEEGTTITIKI